MVDPHAKLEIRGGATNISQVTQHGSLHVIESHVTVLHDLPEQTFVCWPVCQLRHASDCSREVGGVKREVGRRTRAHAEPLRERVR